MSPPGARRHTSVVAPRVVSALDGPSAAEVLLALAVVCTPLAIGGVHLATQILLAVATVGAFAWAALRLRRERRKVYVGLFGLALGVAFVWTVLQWLPLPSGLAGALSPASADARALTAAATGVSVPSFFPISLDGGLTAAAIVGLLGLGGAFLAGLNLRSDAGVSQRVVLYVEIAALVTLALGVLHRVVGLDLIYGFYEPATADLGDRLLITPFVNPNHAAALMLFGAMLAFGTWLAASKEKRWHLVTGVALSVGVLATMSRANTILLFVGLGVLGVYARVASRRDDAPAGRYVRLLIGVLCLAFVAIVLMGPERWLGELATLTDSAASDGLLGGVWSVGAHVAGQQPFFGVGAGTFGVVAPAVMPTWSTGLVSYAHNGVLHIVAELGVVVGGLVVGLCLAALGHFLYRARVDLQHAGVAVGLLLLVVQNMVDFSLWIPGVAIPVAAAVGASVSATWYAEPRLRGRTRQGPRPVRGVERLAFRWALPASAVLVGTLVVTALHAWNERPVAWQADVRAHLADDRPGAVPMDAILLAHPHDYYAFRLGSLLATRAGKPERADRLLERAAALAPFEPDTVEALARMQLRASDAEARATVLRLADLGPAAERRAIRLILAHRDDEALMRSFFERRPELVRRGADELYALGDQEAADRLLLWGTERFADAIPLFEALAARWARRVDRRAALDALAARLLGRAGAADDASLAAPWGRIGYLAQGHVLMLDGRWLEAWHIYTAAARVDPTNATQPLLAAGRAAARLERADLMDEVIGQLDGQDIRGAWPSGEYHWLRSLRAEWSGDLRVAIREMQHAIRFLPRHAGFHDRLGALYGRAGDPVSAQRARDRSVELTAPATDDAAADTDG